MTCRCFGVICHCDIILYVYIIYMYVRYLCTYYVCVYVSLYLRINTRIHTVLRICKHGGYHSPAPQLFYFFPAVSWYNGWVYSMIWIDMVNTGWSEIIIVKNSWELLCHDPWSWLFRMVHDGWWPFLIEWNLNPWLGTQDLPPASWKCSVFLMGLWWYNYLWGIGLPSLKASATLRTWRLMAASKLVITTVMFRGYPIYLLPGYSELSNPRRMPIHYKLSNQWHLFRGLSAHLWPNQDDEPKVYGWASNAAVDEVDEPS